MTIPSRILLLTALAMAAFAANSLLCRLALKQTGIDAATFTTVRIVSGALVLGVIAGAKGAWPWRTAGVGGSWISALALFIYATGFSWAYVRLPTAAGALILFGSVQSTMIGYGLAKGERPGIMQIFGLCLALGGLVALLVPGLSAAPPLGSSLLMLSAGVAWGVYSLRGKGMGDPTLATAGNFIRAVPMALMLILIQALLPLFGSVSAGGISWDFGGICYAVASGAIASGIGYAIWYSVLPSLPASTAASVQLSVPVFAAAGGTLFLGEAITLHLALSCVAILGGIGCVISGRGKA